MDLLNDTIRDQIRAALGDAMDTFHKSILVYHRKRVSLDPEQEDNQDRSTTEWVIPCLVVPVSTDSTEAIRTPDGTRENNELQVNVAMKDLVALDAGIVDTDTWVVDMDPATDFFMINTGKGRYYKVLRVTKHGPLDKQDVIVKIIGRIETKELPYA